MGKTPTIDSFFKRKHVPSVEVNEVSVTSSPNTQASPADTEIERVEQRPSKVPRVEVDNWDINDLVRDPGKRSDIWKCPVNLLDEVRRAYINFGPYQWMVDEKEYPLSNEKHPRRFKPSWYSKFPSWLEYSPSTDAAYCLPCYLFNKEGAHHGQTTFSKDGFRNWGRVMGKKCAFLKHEGKDPNSLHKLAQKSCEDLMNQPQHIQNIFEKHTSEEIANNRLRLKASIDSVRYLTLQGLALRGHDESKDSSNRGNFLELLKLLAEYNEDVANVVLDNAPQNASYISSQIQKEILQVYSMKIKEVIREEIGEAKFCILVDEARDESKREQMAIVLRYVDKDGLVRERFFGLVHVSNTKAITLKDAIFSTLARHNLDIQNIRGQGYDGASNMRGEWNGLQALVARECPSAYYVHCFAHRLQLALVATAKEVRFVQQFFRQLSFIINIVGASCKRSDELKAAQASDIAYLISIDEVETGTGMNQMNTLQRAGDTRWGSHLRSISSLLKMFSATCQVLLNIIDDGNFEQRGDADSAYTSLTSFEFVFILHLMKEIMEITDMLSQSLQRKSQDILNAMHLVETTKNLIQQFKDNGCETFFMKVKSFCVMHTVDVPNMDALYVGKRGETPPGNFTVMDHYRVNIFIATIDSQMQELNNRFSEHAIQLLVLSSALDPQNLNVSFKIEDICKLVDEFYPRDFTDHERDELQTQLRFYENDVPKRPEFESLSTLSELCQWLVKTRKAKIYPLIDRLIRLVLTLPVSTATTERAFSAMNHVKSELRNKMEDDYLNNSLMVNIEKEIARQFKVDSIIEAFRDLKERRVRF